MEKQSIFELFLLVGMGVLYTNLKPLLISQKARKKQISTIQILNTTPKLQLYTGYNLDVYLSFNVW